MRPQAGSGAGGVIQFESAGLRAGGQQRKSEFKGRRRRSRWSQPCQ